MRKYNVHCPHCDGPLESTPRLHIYERLVRSWRRRCFKQEEEIKSLEKKLEKTEGELVTLEANAIKRIE